VQSTDFTTTIAVEQSPEEAFAAITDVRGWWSGNIEGSTDELGAEFSYRYKDVHYSKQRITELVAGKTVTWEILESMLDFTSDPNEWAGTTVTFEISREAGQTKVRFAHIGLTPESECFDSCSSAWGFYINTSLKDLITAGRGEPNPPEVVAAG
jgi:Activator of Hsp90 ATPase homolog 1-like protein